MNDNNQYCTFLVDGLLFGVGVKVVQEVIRYQQMTMVPLAPREIGGLINLRGQIVTAVELRRRLGLPDRADAAKPMNVVVRTEEGAVSLLVDEIGEVVSIDPSTFEPPPETLTGAARALIDGVYKLKGRLLLVLNTDKAVNVC
ncbi:MAG TPA: chemotaxis protein CheW [Tepidisphaeraceae bacterium]|jgi:purine-binding chemotaxis protein CheW